MKNHWLKQRDGIWWLKVEGRICKIHEIRPTLHVPETQLPDGSHLLCWKEATWLPIELNMDNLWYGTKDVEIFFNRKKVWELFTLKNAEMNNGLITYTNATYVHKKEDYQYEMKATPMRPCS